MLARYKGFDEEDKTWVYLYIMREDVPQMVMDYLISLQREGTARQRRLVERLQTTTASNPAVGGVFQPPGRMAHYMESNLDQIDLYITDTDCCRKNLDKAIRSQSKTIMLTTKNLYV